MKKQQFKTNIKCGNCVATVTPNLNQVAGESKWGVDLASPDRVLTVEGEIAESEVIEAVKKAGYEAVPTGN